MNEQEILNEQNEALNVLIEAVKYAQSKGTYTLEQAALILKAIKIFEFEVQEPSVNENKIENQESLNA